MSISITDLITTIQNSEKSNKIQELNGVLSKAIAHSELAGVDINTAEHSMDEMASKNDIWVQHLKDNLSNFKFGDPPRDVELDNGFKLTASQVDDGLYEGQVRNNNPESGEYGEVVFRISKMTAPQMVQALKAKEFIVEPPSEPVAVDPIDEEKETLKSIIRALVEAQMTPPQITINVEKSEHEDIRENPTDSDKPT